MLLSSELQKKALLEAAANALTRFERTSDVTLPLQKEITLFDEAGIPHTVISPQARIRFFTKDRRKNVNHFIIFLTNPEPGSVSLTCRYSPKTGKLDISGLQDKSAAQVGRMNQAARGLRQFAY